MLPDKNLRLVRIYTYSIHALVDTMINKPIACSLMKVARRVYARLSFCHRLYIYSPSFCLSCGVKPRDVTRHAPRIIPRAIRCTQHALYTERKERYTLGLPTTSSYQPEFSSGIRLNRTGRAHICTCANGVIHCCAARPVQGEGDKSARDVFLSSRTTD